MPGTGGPRPALNPFASAWQPGAAAEQLGALHLGPADVPGSGGKRGGGGGDSRPRPALAPTDAMQHALAYLNGAAARPAAAATAAAAAPASCPAAAAAAGGEADGEGGGELHFDLHYGEDEAERTLSTASSAEQSPQVSVSGRRRGSEAGHSSSGSKRGVLRRAGPARAQHSSRPAQRLNPPEDAAGAPGKRAALSLHATAATARHVSQPAPLMRLFLPSPPLLCLPASCPQLVGPSPMPSPAKASPHPSFSSGALLLAATEDTPAAGRSKAALEAAAERLAAATEVVAHVETAAGAGVGVRCAGGWGEHWRGALQCVCVCVCVVCV